jgi:hypothetical protein
VSEGGGRNYGAQVFDEVRNVYRSRVVSRGEFDLPVANVTIGLVAVALRANQNLVVAV